MELVKNDNPELEFFDKVDKLLQTVTDKSKPAEERLETVAELLPMMFSAVLEPIQAVMQIEQSLAQSSKIVSVLSMLVERMIEKNIINEDDFMLAELYYQQKMLDAAKANVDAKLVTTTNDEKLLKALSNSQETILNELGKVEREIKRVKNGEKVEIQH